MKPGGLTRRHVLTAFALLGAAHVGACGGDFDTSDESQGWGARSDLKAVPLDSALAFVDATHGTAFMVDAHLGTPHARPIEVGHTVAKYEKRNGKDELLVLSRGLVGTRDVKDEPPALWVLPAAGGVPVKVPLDARYTSFAQSADGTFVMLFFAETNAKAGEVAFNPNQMALVNLSTPTIAPRTLTVPSLGGVPTAIDFSPVLALKQPRPLVLVRSKNYVTLLDLLHGQAENREEISIPLTLPEDGRTLFPVQVEWDVVGPGVFIRVSGGSDIFSVRFAPLDEAATAVAKNDFRAVLSQLAAGTSPSSMVLYNAGEGTRLLVAGADKALFVIDPVSSRTVQIPIEHEVGWLSVWTPVAGPGAGEPTPQALLLPSKASKATFVDLLKLESLKTRNLEVVNLTAPATGLSPFPAQGLAVLQHMDRSLTVLDLAARTVSPIRSDVGIGGLRASGATPSTLYMLTPSERLGLLTLVPGRLGVSDIRLDAPATEVLVTPAALEPDMVSRLLVVHADNGGYVTVMNAATPTRETAKSIRGFVATDLLSRTERNVP
ncbi:MAG: hypothetical protein SF187_28810 [Deltaproteobacteria bacterium]|nr:hypothetical protein [Deltaproteobacteria bacterium]